MHCPVERDALQPALALSWGVIANLIAATLATLTLVAYVLLLASCLYRGELRGVPGIVEGLDVRSSPCFSPFSCQPCMGQGLCRVLILGEWQLAVVPT